MRRYQVPLNAQAVSAAKDLIYVAAPATMMLCVLRATVGQDGGVVSEAARWSLYRVSTTNTGTGITPEPLEKNDPAATFTASYLPGSDNTLSGLRLWSRPFNWATGDEWVPAPEERIWIPPSGKFVLRLEGAPSASKTVTCNLVVMEIG